MAGFVDCHLEGGFDVEGVEGGERGGRARESSSQAGHAPAARRGGVASAATIFMSMSAQTCNKER